MTAAFIVAAVALLALAVDTGRLYAAQTKLQSAANLAALETARYVGGCRKLSETGDTLLSQANTAVERSYETDPPTIAESDFDTGILKTSDGLRKFADTPEGTRPNTVRLTAEDASYEPLFTGLFGKTKPLQASAGATNPVRAQIRIGGQLADVSPQLLPQLLGGTSATVLDPSGLANTSINLADLATELGVATPQQLLGTPVALNTALTGLGNIASGAASNTLDTLADIADSQSVLLRDVLGVVGEPGPDLAVNVGALTGALASLAARNREEPIKLDIDQSLLPSNVANVNALVRLLPPRSGDGPQIAIGPPGVDSNGDPITTVKSAQALVQINIGLLNIGRYSLSNLTLFIELGRADAELLSVNCARAGQIEHVVTIHGKGTAGRIGIGKISDLSGDSPSAKPGKSTLLDLLVASVTVQTNPPVDIPGGESDPPLQFRGKFPATDPLEPETQSIGGQNAGLALSEALGNLTANLDIDVNILFIEVGIGPILNPLAALLQPILGPLLAPVFGALGLNIGGGDVTVDLVDTNQTQLFCTSREDCFESSSN